MACVFEAAQKSPHFSHSSIGPLRLTTWFMASAGAALALDLIFCPGLSLREMSSLGCLALLGSIWSAVIILSCIALSFLSCQLMCATSLQGPQQPRSLHSSPLTGCLVAALEALWPPLRSGPLLSLCPLAPLSVEFLRRSPIYPPRWPHKR